MTIEIGYHPGYRALTLLAKEAAIGKEYHYLSPPTYKINVDSFQKFVDDATEAINKRIKKENEKKSNCNRER